VRGYGIAVASMWIDAHPPPFPTVDRTGRLRQLQSVFCGCGRAGRRHAAPNWRVAYRYAIREQTLCLTRTGAPLPYRVREDLARYDLAEIDAFELDELIHHYKRTTQKLWSFSTASGGQLEMAARTLEWLREQHDLRTGGSGRRRVAEASAAGHPGRLNG
jgi:hypothetical protein